MWGTPCYGLFSGFPQSNTSDDGWVSLNVVSYDVDYIEEPWHVAVLLEMTTSKWLLMRGPVLSFWGRGGVAMAWSSQRVLQVPKLFIRMFPITPHLYHIQFAPSLTLMYKCKRWAVKGSTFVSILQLAHLFPLQLVVQIVFWNLLEFSVAEITSKSISPTILNPNLAK